MKSIKRMLSVLLSVIIVVSCVPVLASAYNKGADAPVWWDFIPGLTDILPFQRYTFRLGDTNGDGKVTAADARICLRASAHLEKIGSENVEDGTADLKRVLAADYNCDGKITASDARSILRVSAKLEKMPEMTINTEVNTEFNVVGLRAEYGEDYAWHAECANGKDVLKELIDDPADVGVEGPTGYWYQLNASEPGEYTVNFEFRSKTDNSVADSFTITFVYK